MIIIRAFILPDAIGCNGHVYDGLARMDEDGEVTVQTFDAEDKVTVTLTPGAITQLYQTFVEGDE
jgi:hypothetical protein